VSIPKALPISGRNLNPWYSKRADTLVTCDGPCDAGSKMSAIVGTVGEFTSFIRHDSTVG